MINKKANSRCRHIMPRTRPGCDDIHLKKSACWAILWGLMLFCLGGVKAETLRTETIADHDFEIQVTAGHDTWLPLILWPANEDVFSLSQKLLAKSLAKHGFEVWQVDLLEALFVPYSDENLRNLDGR
ncbi:MAG: hypothetical protein AAF512_07695, partial [Pseudomonadota bacterium]